MVRQDSTTAQLHHRIPDLIAFIGARIRLRPGDIITTGSPGGSGAGFAPPRWLVPGDVVRVEIEELGHIEHTIVETTV
jgi:2-keto-4-pentenoate hydratase/2-oxohepta-3-ene-1,7-dioic acid hydratase in catechol pathway